MRAAAAQQDRSTDPILDPARLERALSLTVNRTSFATFTVTGGAERHLVDFHRPADRRCDCADAYYRPEFACKHVLACLISVGQSQVIRAVAQHMADLRARAAAAERAARRARPRYRRRSAQPA